MRKDCYEPGRKAYYFGCLEQAGHFLHSTSGNSWLYEQTFPDKSMPIVWWGLLDGGLLRNGNIKDKPDGRVFWTGGGITEHWFAFFWWDRSLDSRGASNSGFYVRGFHHTEKEDAFLYACQTFPKVVIRQQFPLVLQP